MKKRSTALGAILAGMGRITPEDVDRALGHQREHGGYFGEALVAMGVLSAEEVNFALADQYDLPFVNLRPENIDRAVAKTVPAEWARQHRMIPVLRDGDTVTVLLAWPPREGELEAVLRFTGAGRLEPAISTPETIAQLIDAVHLASEPPAALLGEWLRSALEAGAAVLGISVRGGRVSGWYRTADARRVDRGLDGDWRLDLAHHVAPFPPLRDETVRRWPAILTLGAAAWRVECAALGSSGGLEYVIRLDAPVPVDARATGATPELAAAVADHAAAPLTLRVAACADGVAPGLLEVLLPALPEALAGQPVRALHLADRPVAVAAGSLTMQPAGPLADLLEAAAFFELEAITLDVARLEPADLELARRAAPLVVVREAAPHSSRLRTDLDVGLRPGDQPCWTLLS